MARSLRILPFVCALTALSSCTVHDQQAAPALSGPSGNGTSLQVTVTPDILTQDGQSQSLVLISAFGPNGQPYASLPLRAQISVGGAVTDFGSLSARNLVTDAAGRATVTYTAPPAPVLNQDSGTIVAISIAPLSTDFANNNPVQASIRLMPPGAVGAPPSTLKPDFVVPTVTVGNPTQFQATVVDASGADATAQVSSYQWTFGDGGSGSGRNVTHTYTKSGSFPVSLTITDSLGRTQNVTHSLTIGQGQIPTATFVTSPSSPIIDQQINFNASGSQAEPGHTITSWAWNFGDGTLADGPLVTHSYPLAGSYTVTLKTTDDAGRKSDLTSQAITVTNGNPAPDFTFNPSAPRAGQNVTFDGSPSQPFGGRTIVSYSWSFGDGGSGTGQVVNHSFPVVGGVATTYNVLLTVTDSAGKTGSITKAITINP
ncbi:MAG TPA: PKD domain-containing protein [Vicinamibacterales bacterium]|jgi:PKD repeat protein